jgi:hypothetical protein
MLPYNLKRFRCYRCNIAWFSNSEFKDVFCNKCKFILPCKDCKQNFNSSKSYHRSICDNCSLKKNCTICKKQFIGNGVFDNQCRPCRIIVSNINDKKQNKSVYKNFKLKITFEYCIEKNQTKAIGSIEKSFNLLNMFTPDNIDENGNININDPINQQYLKYYQLTNFDYSIIDSTITKARVAMN